jgi:hypothetical protein
MTTPKKKRTPQEVVRAIEEQALVDEQERVKNLSDAGVDAEIRGAGGDPEGIASRAEAFVAKLKEKRRAEWEASARDKLDAARSVLSKREARPGVAKTRGLTRQELIERIEAARNDPRYTQKIAVAFRDRKLDESTDEQLEAMLDSIEDLVRLDDLLE